MGPPHFGIVIQGPLDSRGFDTRPNILKYLAQADALPEFRFTFCLSTWRGAELGSLVPAAERLQILWNTPPPGRDYENRRRQIVSALAGVRRLTAGGQRDFLLKVRTDQELSLEALCRHLLKLQAAGELTSTTVVVPGASASIPFLIPDFFYGGTMDAMLFFFESISVRSEAPWQHAVEIDFAWKFLAAIPGTALSEYSNWRRRRQLFYSPWLVRGGLYRRAAEAWQRDARHFRFFPRAVYAGMRWRGAAPATGDLHLWPDLLFHEDLPGGAPAPPEPSALYPRFDPIVYLLLLLYSVELWISALLRLRPRAAFERLAFRRRQKMFHVPPAQATAA